MAGESLARLEKLWEPSWAVIHSRLWPHGLLHPHPSSICCHQRRAAPSCVNPWLFYFEYCSPLPSIHILPCLLAKLEGLCGTCSLISTKQLTDVKASQAPGDACWLLKSAKCLSIHQRRCNKPWHSYRAESPSLQIRLSETGLRKLCRPERGGRQSKQVSSA